MCDFHVPHMKIDERVVRVTLPSFQESSSFLACRSKLEGFKEMMNCLSTICFQEYFCSYEDVCLLHMCADSLKFKYQF